MPASSVKSKRHLEPNHRRKVRLSAASLPQIERRAKMDLAFSVIKTNPNKDSSVNAEVEPHSSWKMREKIEPMRTRINAIPAPKTGTKSAQYLYNNGVTSNSSLNSSQEPRSTNNLEFRRQVLSARPRYVAMSSRQSERQTQFKLPRQLL